MNTTLFRIASVSGCLAASTALFAQTPAATTAAHHATPTTAHRPVGHAAPGCAAVPPLSPKIPALPSGTGCAKVLYTITSAATQLSPMLSPGLKDSLVKLNQSFSLAYIDTRPGKGALAAAKMYYTVNYTGYLPDGTKFDSSEGKDPITFPYGARRVIQGWDSGFDGMHVGGKRRLFVPYQLAYGEAGRPPVIPAKAMLIFDVELLSQSDQPPASKTPPAPPAGAKGATGVTGSTAVPPATGGTGSTGPRAVPPASAQPGSKPATPPVTSTTPASPATPTGAAPAPRQ